MVLAMADVFGLEVKNLTPDGNPTPGAPRPFDTTMSTERLESLGIDQHTLFKDGIKECLQSWA